MIFVMCGRNLASIEYTMNLQFWSKYIPVAWSWDNMIADIYDLLIINIMTFDYM